MGTTLLAIMFHIFLKAPTEWHLRTDQVEALHISFFFGYWVIILLAEPITGAHYNPAITFAHLFKREAKFNKILCIFYLIAQFAGGFVGAVLGIFFTKHGAFLTIKNMDNSFLFQAVVIEILASFIFTLIFLTQSEKTTRFSEDPALTYLFVSIGYSSCLALTTPVSGGCINPAIGLGLNLINFFDNGSKESIEWIWVYTLMPFVGSLLAIFVYEAKFKQMQQQANDQHVIENDFDSKRDETVGMITGLIKFS